MRFDIITLEQQTSRAFFPSVSAVSKTKITVCAVASYNLEIYEMQLTSVLQTEV